MKKLNVALVGLGVVGKSVYEILINQNDLISKRCAGKIQLKKVSARSKKDFVDHEKVEFVENILDLANDENIDVIIEVAGGESENILNLWRQSLKNGKKIITANKALLANHGFELAKLAQENGGYIAYEAAVAGAIPIVKIFKEALSANKIEAFYGILNGTSNYILTKMKEENIDFKVALKQAQDAGYAEVDPTFDVEGIDAGHKLAILSAIASSSKLNFDKQYMEGISKITIDDINFADEIGYKIKLLAIFKNLKNSNQQTIYPALIKKNQHIAMVDDSFNAIFSKNSNAGDNFVVGRGAGGFQTASAVVSDLIDVANDRFSFEFQIQAQDLQNVEIQDISQRFGKYFVKFTIENSSEKNQIIKEFAQNIKAEKSHFVRKENDEMICVLTSENLVESEFIKYFKNLDAKEKSFIRIEEIS